MCSRKEVRRAQKAQDSAARALRIACDGECSERIGKALRSLYDTTAKEPIPDRFNQLLGRLA